MARGLYEFERCVWLLQRRQITTIYRDTSGKLPKTIRRKLWLIKTFATTPVYTSKHEGESRTSIINCNLLDIITLSVVTIYQSIKTSVRMMDLCICK